MLKSGSKSGSKCKQVEEFMEERIYGLDIWDKCGHRVICKGLKMIDDNSNVEERRIFVIW